MIENVKKVFQKYATFSGRADRPEYWWFALFNVIVSMVLTYGIGLTLGITILGNIWALVTLIPGIAVAVRRLHDINKSGWFLLVILIPLIGAIWLIVLLATEGTHGPNNYGPDPKTIGEAFDIENNRLDF